MSPTRSKRRRDALQFGRPHILALFTAHPDTWELDEVPEWLLHDCRTMGLVAEVEPGRWKMTAAGYAALKKASGE